MFDMIVIAVDYLGQAVSALEFIAIRLIVKLFGLGEVFSDDGLKWPSGRYLERRDEARMENIPSNSKILLTTLSSLRLPPAPPALRLPNNSQRVRKSLRLLV